MGQGLTMQSTEIFISGPVAIVWQYAYVYFVLLGHASAIEEAVIRTLVGFVRYRRRVCGRSRTAQEGFERDCCRCCRQSCGALDELSSAYLRLPSVRSDRILFFFFHVIAPLHVRTTTVGKCV